MIKVNSIYLSPLHIITIFAQRLSEGKIVKSSRF